MTVYRLLKILLLSFLLISNEEVQAMQSGAAFWATTGIAIGVVGLLAVQRCLRARRAPDGVVSGVALEVGVPRSEACTCAVCSGLFDRAHVVRGADAFGCPDGQYDIEHFFCAQCVRRIRNRGRSFICPVCGHTPILGRVTPAEEMAEGKINTVVFDCVPADGCVSDARQIVRYYDKDARQLCFRRLFSKDAERVGSLVGNIFRQIAANMGSGQVFEGLKEIDLAFTNIIALPAEIGVLTGLRKLCLSNTPLRRLPLEVGNLAHLQELDVSATPMDELPVTIGWLVRLKELVLLNSNVIRLPDEIGRLENLQKLTISGSRITSLPDAIGNLTRLLVLCVEDSPVRRLPASIGRLVNLQRLDLAGAAFDTLPDEIQYLRNLSYINLFRSRIRRLPAAVGSLVNLKELDLSLSQLDSLPDEIGGLSQLINLDLGQTHINCLPATIGGLVCLKTLLLRGTLLRFLPDQMARLGALFHLYLSGTQINEWPAVIERIPNLCYLEVDETPLVRSAGWPEQKMHIRKRIPRVNVQDTTSLCCVM